MPRTRKPSAIRTNRSRTVCSIVRSLAIGPVYECHQPQSLRYSVGTGNSRCSTRFPRSTGDHLIHPRPPRALAREPPQPSEIHRIVSSFRPPCLRVPRAWGRSRFALKTQSSHRDPLHLTPDPAPGAFGRIILTPASGCGRLRCVVRHSCAACGGSPRVGGTAWSRPEGWAAAGPKRNFVSPSRGRNWKARDRICELAETGRPPLK